MMSKITKYLFIIAVSCIFIACSKKIININDLIHFTNDSENTGSFSISNAPKGFRGYYGDSPTTITYSISGTTNGCTFFTYESDGMSNDDRSLSGITYADENGVYLSVLCDDSTLDHTEHNIVVNITFKIGATTYTGAASGLLTNTSNEDNGGGSGGGTNTSRSITFIGEYSSEGYTPGSYSESMGGTLIVEDGRAVYTCPAGFVVDDDVLRPASGSSQTLTCSKEGGCDGYAMYLFKPDLFIGSDISVDKGDTVTIMGNNNDGRLSLTCVRPSDIKYWN